MWKNVEPAPPDAILGLTEAFRSDTNPDKVNLGVGVYKDDRGRTPVLEVVKEAEKRLLEEQDSKSYLPISGDAGYCRLVQELILGRESETVTSARVATVQAPGGTGALRVGADLLKKFHPEARVWVSAPTWANHNGIFTAAGFSISQYRYYDAASRGLDEQGLLDSLETVPAGDIVVLHACCHNPSGVDLEPRQWDQVAQIARKKGWIPFLDFAYQGFGDGVEEDRYALERFASAGVDFLVASSFSKNFGLYNERTGALSVICKDSEQAGVALSHVKTVIRTNYSNPPAHGALAAATVLADPGLDGQWRQELAAMRERIKSMRSALVKGLAACGVQEDFSFLERQRGMFSFSGLSDDAVAWLRREKSIYVVGGGRINVAGLTTSNIDYVCQSIAEALRAVGAPR